MLRTNLRDTMTFEANTSGELALSLADNTPADFAATFPQDESNLILRAAAALRMVGRHSRGARIIVEKRIPAEAGLAGGSSNAATTLLGLNQLWNMDLSKTELHRIAATLGSDINFFVEDCAAAVCRGRGELVTPIPLGAEFHFVVARPARGNATPDVFSALELPTDLKNSRDVAGALLAGDTDELQRGIFNRLTSAAEQINPDMRELMSRMSALSDRPVFMSGSGSTCFLVCANEQEAADVFSQCEAAGAEFSLAVRSV